MKKVFVILIICLLFITGCSENKDDYKTLMNEKTYTIVDVRTIDEYNEGHIVDAINIPYDEINENIKLDKNDNIFVYCKSGKRSQIAYQSLKKLGYNVYDLGAYDSIDLPKE